jgi:hypothetical protein
MKKIWIRKRVEKTLLLTQPDHFAGPGHVIVEQEIIFYSFLALVLSLK